MPLTVTRRKDNDTLQITGRIDFPPSPEHPEGYQRRIRLVPQSTDIKLAREEAAALETRLIREAIHGKPAAVVDPLFAEAAKGYLTAKRRAKPEQKRVTRVVVALGEGKCCSEVDQPAVNDLRGTMFKTPPSEATVLRAVITPIRSVLRYARRHMKYREMIPEFEIPKQPEGRTNFMFPAEVKGLFFASAAHAADQFLFCVGSGARVSEGIYIEWPDIDLINAKATFWPLRKNDDGEMIRNTKSGKRRVADLPPVVVHRLRLLAARCETRTSDGRPTGKVFRWKRTPPARLIRQAERVSDRLDRLLSQLTETRSERTRRPLEDHIRALRAKESRLNESIERASRSFDYADHNGEYGGQSKTAWRGALRRAGLNPELRPHDLRHTWASWHYAVNTNPLKLKEDGGWHSLNQVERYAHLMPGGYQDQIREFLAGHWLVTATDLLPATHSEQMAI